MQRNTGSGILFLLACLLAGCGGSGDEYDGFEGNEVGRSTPNGFLTFFNRQGDLGAGNYRLVVATAGGNQSGSFSLSLRRNNGSAEQIITGSWSNSFGPSATPQNTCSGNPSNRCFDISLEDASGLSIVLDSARDGRLYLLGNDNNLVASGGNSLVFSESEIDETGFSNAYYAAIDPGNARTTMQDYISLHGLNNPDVHVIFRDSKDLGYGRDMYMRSYPNPSSCGGEMLAFYVRNFSVQIVEGFAYGPVNLEAAIAADLQHHIGTNAIEFGLGRADVGDTCSTEPVAKFYTFRPVYSPPGALHPRRDRVDLDARGAKAMPQPCISCHGGKLRPLDRFGRFVAMHASDSYVPGTYPPNAGDTSDIGDTKARLQAFEVDTFEFSDEVGHRRIDYEEGLRILNSVIYCTYPGSDGHPACNGLDFDDSGIGGVAARDIVGDPDEIGEWSGDFGREVLLGWYGNALQTPGAVFDDSFVPAGWTPSGGGPPVGADSLFTKVIGPNCFVCHGKRGNELGSNNDASGDGKDIDFSTWEKFISHADEIERLVFDEGKMPMGLLNFNNFWNDPEKAELLASFIAPYVSDTAGFEGRRLDGSGGIIEPGEQVVARAGPDRITQPNAAITLNAQASLFADSYRWEILSRPGGASAQLSNTGSMRTDFSANTDGEYIVRLTVSSSENGTARTDSLKVVVDNTLPVAPRSLAFYSDIETPLGGCAGSCHSNGAQAGVPVWWVDDASQPLGIPSDATDPPSLGFYEQIMARVNLEYIEDSLILKKPSGVHHFGGNTAIGQGFDISREVGHPDRANYDIFVNWIAEGAPCGGTADQCVR